MIQFLFRSPTVKCGGQRRAIAIARREEEEWGVWEGEGRWPMQWTRCSWSLSSGWQDLRDDLERQGFDVSRIRILSEENIEQTRSYQAEVEMNRREALLRLLYRNF